MSSRLFEQNGFTTPAVGLGAWQLGGDWGSLDDQQAEEILGAAADNGIKFIDTADVYGTGISESRIGKFLKERRAKFFLATKLGRFPEPGWPENFSQKVFREHTEASLKRLGVEALDLTQVHCLPFECLKKGEIFGWLEDLKQEGKIKNFGLSVESMDEALYCLEQDGVASLQIIFNIFRQKPIDVLFDKAKEKDVALIVRLPLASGLLSGKFDKNTQFSGEDHRSYNRDGQVFNVGETFAGIPLETGLKLADELKAFVPEGTDMAQMAIRWILDYDAVSVVIPGATSAGQVISNAAAGELPPLSEDLHSKLKDFYQTKVVQHIRGVY